MFQESIVNKVRDHLEKSKLPIAIKLWNGTSIAPVGKPKMEISVHSMNVLKDLARPTMGKLAKHYVEEDIDLEGDIQDILQVSEDLCDADAAVRGGSSDRKSSKHAKSTDREWIQSHYDVGNEFYALWLDKNRAYSCAYFRHADDTLDLAQEYKFDHICKKLNLKSGERFLDIGCGWGGLIFWAVKNYDVRATGITLSEEQLSFVQTKIKELGIEDRCEVFLKDYRDLPNEELFDKIASVGMFEHVGEKNLPVYFGKIYSLLKPGGLVMNHGIAAGDLNPGDMGSDITNFIQEYVFPGGELVHLSQVISQMANQNLECWDVESLRPHYVKTLWHWVSRLEARRQEACKLVGEKKYRIWKIYMAGSARAFERGWVSIFQILGGKPLAKGGWPFPMTRDNIYK
jgi:cyclopropane-fatty-acyl-phospholipid synthase